MGGTGRGGDSDKHGNGKSEEYDEYCSANMLHHMSRLKSSEQHADCGEVHKMGSYEGLDESTFRRQPSGSSEEVLERRRRMEYRAVLRAAAYAEAALQPLTA
jgi:hypothetical protein